MKNILRTNKKLLDFVDITGKDESEIFFLLGYKNCESYWNGDEFTDMVAMYATNIAKVSDVIYLLEYQLGRLKIILNEKGDISLNAPSDSS